MMGPAGFILAILGCGEADAPCQQVQMTQVRYETEAACLAATEDAVARHSDLPYPVVVAECRGAGAQPAAIRADQVVLPKPEFPRITIASRR